MTYNVNDYLRAEAAAQRELEAWSREYHRASLSDTVREFEGYLEQAEQAARDAAYSVAYHRKQLKRGELSNDWLEQAQDRDEAARKELENTRARLARFRADLAELR